MFLTDLPRVLLRRWYLVLVGLIATAGLSAFAYTKTPPTYTSSAEILLLPPQTSVPAGGNPYLFLGGLQAAGDIVAKAMSADKTVAQLKAEGLTGGYTLGLDANAAAPMILVATEAPTPTASERSMALILQELPRLLTTVQIDASAPSNALISSTVITRTATPVKSLKPVVRGLGLATVAGLALTLAFTASLDSLAQRRSTGGRQTPVTSSRSAARQRRKVKSHLSRKTPPAPATDSGTPRSDAEGVLATSSGAPRFPRQIERVATEGDDHPDHKSLEDGDLELQSRAAKLTPTSG